MGRKPRVHFPGALYHVIARGNQRQAIFRSDSDRRRYLDLLNQYRKRYNFHLYAYVLMSNHVHLLLEVCETPLAKAMQGLQQSYTLYFNRKYKLVGHLFQGRYKDILCDRDAYLLELVRYIHLNPVRSKIVDSAGNYAWSSHHAYVSAGDYETVECDWILKRFSPQRAQARRLFEQFVLDGASAGHREEFYAVKEQRYLGDDEFLERVDTKIYAKLSRPRPFDLADIESAVCRHFELPVNLLRSRSKDRGGSFGRALVAWLGQELGGTALNQVAKRYDRDQVTVSLGLKALRQRIGQNSKLKRDVESLLIELRTGQNKLKGTIPRPKELN
jgi:putative transposase